MKKDMVFIMAPMQGVTGHIYREVYVKHFSGFYESAMSPYITGNNVSRIREKMFVDVLPRNNSGGIKVIPQIMGNNSEDFLMIAKLLNDMGYNHVNWNLGCPYPMVRNKKRGSGLLSFPGLIFKFLDEVIPISPCSVSLKVRLGVEDKEELFRLLPGLDKYPLEYIILHPRIAVQLYSGSVDLDAFERVLAATCHKIIYNGDIFTKEDFARISARFPCIDSWMLGRGGVINPFLPGEIKGTAVSGSERFRAFHNDLLSAYKECLNGSSHLLHKMKELWSYWAVRFAQPEKVLKTITKAGTLEAYLEKVELFLQ